MKIIYDLSIYPGNKVIAPMFKLQRLIYEINTAFIAPRSDRYGNSQLLCLDQTFFCFLINRFLRGQQLGRAL